MTENRIRTNMLYVNTIKPHFQAEDVEIILVLKGTITIQKVENENFHLEVFQMIKF